MSRLTKQKIRHLILYFTEIFIVSSCITYLLECSHPSSSLYEIIEKFFLSYGVYQLLIYTSFSIIDDISRDSTLMLRTLLKYCLLYKECRCEQLKELINKKIDHQISYRTMNSSETEEFLMNLKQNLESIDKVYLEYKIITVEHNLDFYQLHWRLSILLRLFK